MNKKVKKFLKNIKNIDMVECLRCKEPIPKGFWISVFNDKQGNLCEVCGDYFYLQGNRALKEAEAELEAKGVPVLTTKEKYGIWTIYLGNVEDTEWVDKLAEKYKQKYPELSFTFF